MKQEPRFADTTPWAVGLARSAPRTEPQTRPPATTDGLPVLTDVVEPEAVSALKSAVIRYRPATRPPAPPPSPSSPPPHAPPPPQAPPPPPPSPAAPVAQTAAAVGLPDMPVLPDPAPALQFSLRTGYNAGFGSGFGPAFGTGLSLPPQPPQVPSLAEHAAALERELAHALETWLSDELPLILAREFDGLVERLRAQTLARMRHELLPELHERITRQLRSGD